MTILRFASSIQAAVTPLLLVLFTAGAGAQVASEDIDLDEPVVPRETVLIFEEAEALFQTVDQAETVPLFGQVIDALEPLRPLGDVEVLGLLRNSLVYRARANFNLGENEATELDLERLLRMDPSYDVDRTVVSSKLSQLFDGLRDRLIGQVELVVEPQDARVTVDGQPLEAGIGAIPFLAGSYVAEVVRAGYTPTTIAFDVEAGETASLEALLERTSAVVSIRTSPPGAQVLIDGILRAETDGPAEPTFVPPAGSTRSDFSMMSMLDEVSPGQHVIEVRYEGFRTYRASLDVTEPRDFVLRPVVLEAQSGTVIFKNLESGSVTTIDGRQVRPRPSSQAGESELVLAPGSYRISVTKGSLGVFETQIDVADRETALVDVKLRPALVLLGVLGGDEVGARRLKDSLLAAFSRSGHWALLDRSREGEQALRESNVEIGVLRRLAELGTPMGAGIDWQRLQQLSDARTPGSVYLLAALNDDLIAQRASIWTWPAAPGPSRPDLRSISLDDPTASEELVQAFRPALDTRHVHIGAVLIDSAAGAGPVVAQLTSDGAGAAAGLRIGDEITAIDGAPVFSVAQVEEKLTGAAGSTLRFEAVRGGQTLSLDIEPQSSNTVIDVTDPDLIRAAAAAELNTELARESDRSPRWLLQLNHAAILLRSGDYESAVRELRRIETPSTRGLGRATVDYWIGLALLRLSVEQASYVEPAKSSFEKAVQAGDGRLLHDDGPFVAARARARLARLGAGSN